MEKYPVVESKRIEDVSSFPKIPVDTYLEITPRIEGTFNPVEEVKKLTKFPKEQKREAIKEFRKKLSAQREGLGYCRIEAQKRIEANPNISREELVDIFNQFSELYGFTEEQKKLAEKIVDRFIQNREIINQFVLNNPNTRDVVKKLFGHEVKPSEESDYEISTTPYCIKVLSTRNNVNNLYNKVRGEKSSEETGVLGFAKPFSTVNGESIPSSIVVSTDSEFVDLDTESIEDHEIQHIQNNLIEFALEDSNDGSSLLRVIGNVSEKRTLIEKIQYKIVLGLLKYKKINDYLIRANYLSMKEGEERDLLLEEYFTYRRDYALLRAKDELLAMFREKNIRSDYNVFHKDSTYDYMKDLREFSKIVASDKDNELYEKICEKEYQDNINQAINAFNSLLKFGYNREQATSVLTGLGLEKWSKFVDRLILEKRILQTGVIKDVKEITQLSQDDINSLLEVPESNWAEILRSILRREKS